MIVLNNYIIKKARQLRAFFLVEPGRVELPSKSLFLKVSPSAVISLYSFLSRLITKCLKI